ncbi:hypothetical protein ACIF6L_31950 [Kitasatospora sp. NPDC086009]|uniref:hypothetical protein n=1 Tax=unclassified Kitasatospora TaxID=2633591 RepID=UPI0037CB9FEB
MADEDQSDPRFESGIGDAFSALGQSFHPTTGPRLDEVTARGHSLRRRRMATLAGSVTALVAIGVGGVFAVGHSTPAPSGDTVNTAALPSVTTPPPTSQSTSAQPPQANADLRPPSPEAQPGGDEILTVAAALLPRGLTVADATAEKGYVSFNLDDGHGKAEVQIYVAKQPAGAPDPRYDISTTMPDGSKLVTHQPPPSTGSDLVRWSADILRPDGTRVVVQAFNAAIHKSTVKAKPSRPTPPLTLDQITAIVTDPVWQKHNGK